MFINILVIILLSLVLWTVVQKNQSNYRFNRVNRLRRTFQKSIKINNWGTSYLTQIISDIRKINSLPDVVTKYQKEMENIMKWKNRGIFFNRRRNTLQNVITQAQNSPSIDALIATLQGNVKQQKKAAETAKVAMTKAAKVAMTKAAKVAMTKAASAAKMLGRKGRGMEMKTKKGNYYFYFNS
jgi:hypothetical protein